MKRRIVFIAIILFAFLLVGCSTAKESDSLKESYDVIVVGGEPEGVAAAVSSARNGNKTLLVEQRDGLGGLMTYGMLNFLDISNDQHGDLANAGIFKEWHELVGGEVGFDIQDAKEAFLTLVDKEKNLSLTLETNVNEVIKEDNRLVGIKLTDESGESHTIKAKRFIDGTQDADLAVMAGASYYTGGEDIGLIDRKMAVTLMIHLDNVDWDKIDKAADEDVFGGGEVYSNVGWGFSKLHYDYEPTHPDTRLRGLNLVRENDGSVIINALQVFGIDGLDDEAKQNAIDIGKEETKHIVTYLQANFPGFEDAEIKSMPDELYVRETRHIKAEYQLPLSDVWENKDHWDSIGFGSYPVDVQATSANDFGYVYGRPTQYAIPFRSLVPLEVDGLLVANKASGYSSLAAASARVLPTGMTTGQAAGVAAAVSISEDISFREMAAEENLIEDIQDTLIDQGANLYTFDIEYPYEDEWFYPAARVLLNYGLILGGYENTLPVDKPITEASFANLLSNGVQRTATSEAEALVENIPDFREKVKDDSELTRDQAAELILALYGKTEIDPDAWKQALDEGLIDDEIFNRVNEDRVLLGAEGYYLAGKLLEEIQ